MKKFYKITLVAIPVLLIILAASGALYHRSKKISYDKNLNADVKAPVSVKRKSSGIPVIQAASMEDLYFSLGFVHGQDRLYIMEYYRAMANAGINNFFGKHVEGLDRIVSALGIPLKGRMLMEKIQKPFRDYIEAYARGINLARKRTTIKKEFKREWNGSDIMTILLLLELSQAYLNNQENIFQFPDTAGKAQLQMIFPDNLLRYYSKDDEKSVILIRKIREVFSRHIGSYNYGLSIFIGPKKSKTGTPATAYSFNSSLNIYPLLYPVVIQLDGITIEGMTQTGLPFIIAGDNQNVTFAGFNLKTDTQDFIMEKIQVIDGTPNYMSRTGWKKFGNARVPVYDSNNNEVNEIIMITDNGPVLNSMFKDEKISTSAVTLKMIVPGEDYIHSLFLIPFAKNIQSSAALVQNIYSLPKVYLFSDKKSSIKAYSGKIPLRQAGNSVFNTGTASDYDNPADLSYNLQISEYLNIAGSSIFHDAPNNLKNISNSDEYTAQRLIKLSDKTDVTSVRDMIEIISDRHSHYAEKFVPKFLALMGNNPITSARISRIYFNEWNMKIEKDMVAPTIFNVLLKNFIHETFEDDIYFLNAGDHDSINTIDYIMKNYPLVITKFFSILDSNNSAFFDNRKTSTLETVEMTFDKAFIKTMRQLNRKRGPVMDDWNWGDFHKGQFKIPKNEYSLLSRFIHPIRNNAMGGGLSTVFTGKFDDTFEPVEVTSLLWASYKIETRFNMNFSPSISPYSKFYHGIHAGQGDNFIDVKNSELIHTTQINPAK